MINKKDKAAMDEAVLSVLNKDFGTMTYVVRNKLVMSRAVPKGSKADFIRDSLKRLEKAGKVRRAHSIYATQLCWQIAQ